MKKFIGLFIPILMLFSLVSSAFALNPVISRVPEDKFISTDEYLVWCKDAVEWTKKEHLMNDIVYNHEIGEYDWNYYYTSFFCDRTITRSEVAAILSRYNGSYETLEGFYAATCPTFVDVPDGVWYTPAAQWAYENGIINGVGDDCFAPERTITREEFAAMLYRYTNYLEVDTSARVDYSEYADSESVSDWATDAMSWAVAEGLINGKPGKLLAPQDTITRAEVATVIYRYNNEVKAHRDIWDGTQG